MKSETFASRLQDEFHPPVGNLLSLTYWDAQTTAKLLYALVPYIGQAVMTNVQSQTQANIDIYDIPSARAILPYIGPYTSSVVRTPEGILTTSTSPLPIPLRIGDEHNRALDRCCPRPPQRADHEQSRGTGSDRGAGGCKAAILTRSRMRPTFAPPAKPGAEMAVGALRRVARLSAGAVRCDHPRGRFPAAAHRFSKCSNSVACV